MQKLRLRSRTPSCRQGALRHVSTPRRSMNPDGGKRLSGSPESLGKVSLRGHFPIQRGAFVIARQIVVFPTIPPFGVLERDA